MDDFLDFGVDTESDPASAIADDRVESTRRIRRVVAAADDGPEAADALALAATLSDLAEGQLVVASVAAFRPGSISPGDRARILAEEEEKLRRRATAQLGDRGFATRVLSGGAAATGIKEIAAAEEADLIVLGSSHRGALGRVLPGSVGERVLNGAPCAVAIAPRGNAATTHGFERVVVGCDGSREAAAAVDLAADLAGRTGARLELLGVVEMKFDLAGFPKPPEATEVERVRRTLERARATVPATVRATTRQVDGDAAEMIAAIAQGADLLLVGSRGHYGPARRLILGSVAAKLARRAPCATLVVPP
jgi:nucleotide-binding universal stress UspA family protein